MLLKVFYNNVCYLLVIGILFVLIILITYSRLLW